VSLGLGSAAVYSRVLRERVIGVLSQDYIKLAFAKGLSETEVVFRHVLKNALLPLVTMWGMTLGSFLGGAVFVETVFAWPGVGKLAVDAIANRDYPVVQCYVLLMAVVYVVLSFLVDVIYPLLDPRVRTGGCGRGA
jgi:ABC-type dipeptide/oligopeptide/nickel transport system permease component